MPVKDREGVGSSDDGVTDSSALPYGCWELNSDPQQEDLSLQPLKTLFDSVSMCCIAVHVQRLERRLWNPLGWSYRHLEAAWLVTPVLAFKLQS